MSTSDLYLRRGCASLRYDHAAHGDLASLIADGWKSYDPTKQGDDACTDTHAWVTSTPCYHGYTWQCGRAPQKWLNPLAVEAKWRDQRYVNAHRRELLAADSQAAGGTGSLDATAERAARFKTLRNKRWSWGDIFAHEDAGRTK